MKVVTIYLVLLIFPLVSLENDDEFCEAGDKRCDSSGSISSKAEKYSGNAAFLPMIKNLEQEYVPCESKNCSCFFKTLKSDLQPYKGGITGKMIEAVRSRGTTYVVFNNRLYRSKECVFPAR